MKSTVPFPLPRKLAAIEIINFERMKAFNIYFVIMYLNLIWLKSDLKKTS